MNMSINYTTNINYIKARDDLIYKEEEDRTLPYYDTEEFVTIGRGFNIYGVIGYFNFVCQIMGIEIDDSEGSYYSRLKKEIEKPVTNNTDLQSRLNLIMQEHYDSLAPQDQQTARQTFTLTVDENGGINEIDAIYQTIINGKENRFNLLFDSIMPDSKERAALMSLFYNAEDLIGDGVKAAVNSGNRAKVWFEIRYHTNGGSSGITTPGRIAQRRVNESNNFGLFVSGS